MDENPIRTLHWYIYRHLYYNRNSTSYVREMWTSKCGPRTNQQTYLYEVKYLYQYTQFIAIFSVNVSDYNNDM
jgi:hypothetical protein